MSILLKLYCYSHETDTEEDAKPLESFSPTHSLIGEPADLQTHSASSPLRGAAGGGPEVTSDKLDARYAGADVDMADVPLLGAEGLVLEDFRCVTVE